MKHWTRRAGILCVLAALCIPAVAQITITASDVTARLTVGNRIINNDDTLTTSVNIGSPGANTLWDFSGLLTHNTTTLTSVAVAATPFVAQYPGATHALKTSLSGAIPGVPGPVSGDLYLYLKAGASNLTNPGNSGAGTILISGISFPGGIVVANAPPDTTYAIPSTLGTRWGSTYSSTTTITINSIPLSQNTVNRALSYLVDAYGSLRVPGGSTQDALRIRKVDTGGGGLTVGYIFLARNGASVQLNASDPNAPNSGVLAVQPKSISWSGPFATSVRVEEATPQEFALQQNYPNPFNPSTTITYQVARAGLVSLKVFNLLGQEVATLVNEVEAPGTYQQTWTAAGMPSGGYFYRLQSGPITLTRTMLLVK